MTPSTFLRVYEKMAHKKNEKVKNGIIVFENIEVLTAGQRDQLA